MSHGGATEVTDLCMALQWQMVKLLEKMACREEKKNDNGKKTQYRQRCNAEEAYDNAHNRKKN
ncbi:hypothetical protein SESBI_38817 [Sesbania bispinosa]|nr:hypothetical protein SESBI_38817 [Sesbania bispinosa]